MATVADHRSAVSDLGSLGRALVQPWRGLDSWIPFRWLTPAPPVRLVQSDGSESLWIGDVRADASAQRLRSARFQAVELPRDEHLECRFALPPMSHADLRDAVALQARAASPFEATDLVWGHREGGPTDTHGQAGQVVAVLASRRQVEQRLERAALGREVGPDPEVWAFDGQGRPVVVEGFGEAARLRRMARGRVLGYALAALALLLAAAVAVTPTAQLKLRAMQAEAATLELERQTAPVLAQREALVRAQADREALREQMAERVEPLMVIDLLTQVVPDDTWLQRLQVQGARATLTGQTPNTSALMNTLDSHPLIHDVKSPTAATRAMGGRKENFTVEMTLAPEALRPLAAPGPAAPAAAASAPAAPRS